MQTDACTDTDTHIIPVTLYKLVKLSLNSFGNLNKHSDL